MKREVDFDALAVCGADFVGGRTPRSEYEGKVLDALGVCLPPDKPVFLFGGIGTREAIEALKKRAAERAQSARYYLVTPEEYAEFQDTKTRLRGYRQAAADFALRVEKLADPVDGPREVSNDMWMALAELRRGEELQRLQRTVGELKATVARGEHYTTIRRVGELEAECKQLKARLKPHEAAPTDTKEPTR